MSFIHPLAHLVSHYSGSQLVSHYSGSQLVSHYSGSQPVSHYSGSQLVSHYSGSQLVRQAGSLKINLPVTHYTRSVSQPVNQAPHPVSKIMVYWTLTFQICFAPIPPPPPPHERKASGTEMEISSQQLEEGDNT